MSKVGLRLGWSCLAALLPVAAFAGSPFDFDSAPGRLPKTVVPLRYRVALVPDVKTLRVDGAETVDLEVRKPTAVLVFNSLGETLRRVRFDGRSVRDVVSDDAQQLTTVRLTAAARPGLHHLSFSYGGKIESQARGLYLQKFTSPSGSGDIMLSTQMEATDARRMFPCWDEPAFRASFQLTVTIPAGWAAVSNMPVARRVDRGQLAVVSFQPSPKMSSYLVEFTAGNMRAVSARQAEVGLGVWAVDGRETDGTTALANAGLILADYNDYFAYPYPLPKLDSIAIPGGFAGAMENWGAITYSDQLLLLRSSSSLEDRQEVFSIQAHEMAHEWFGDLVTMGWWDDIWLNESFASWLAAKETAARNPSWNWWEGEDATKERAMRADAFAASHAIEQHVTDELQAQNSFDSDITYDKGQSILRMLEAYLGEQRFRDGIRGYVKARAFSNANSADLWAALEKVGGVQMGRIAADWTEAPGYPLVTITANCDPSGARTIAMTQRRFLLRGTPAGAVRWHVPLQLRSGPAGEPQPVLLAADGQTAAAGRCDEPLTVNADAIGFYRTQYDEATLATNTRHFGQLPAGDRIALLDDQWALVEAGVAPLDRYLSLAGAMGPDLDARAWEQISGALGTIESAERGAPGHAAFAAYARSLIAPAAGQLGWNAAPDEPPSIGKLRRSLLADLGEWGDPATIAEARRRFLSFLADPRTVAPDDQAMMLRIVAQNADAAQFDQLHALAKRASDETELERDYGALAAVRDPDQAARVAQIALSDEVPPQAALMRLRMILGLHHEHPQLAWDRFTANVEELTAPLAFVAPLFLAQSVPDVFWDAVPADQLEAWVRAHVPSEMTDNVARGMEVARFKAAQKLALVPAADAYVRSR